MRPLGTHLNEITRELVTNNDGIFGHIIRDPLMIGTL